ncbi:MAG: NUDIX domain-containing protein [Geodermatophilaceae bacterium]|jgi:8-oxo-dGTP pyrophosphatase MutT (NUDIX family)|nr:NUDIX domain-containing protein [Geodermatophilaceae bacterium]
MTEDPPRPWRLSARLLLVDPLDRVLLVPVADAEGSWWDLPGGGVEPGESTVAAAVRETLEETGYAVPVHLVGPPCWSGEVVFRWLGAWHWSRQVVHAARAPVLPDPVPVALTEEESGTHGAARWWSVAQAADQRLDIPPFERPEELAELVAGGCVRDAFVRWTAPDSS